MELFDRVREDKALRDWEGTKDTRPASIHASCCSEHGATFLPCFVSAAAPKTLAYLQTKTSSLVSKMTGTLAERSRWIDGYCRDETDRDAR